MPEAIDYKGWVIHMGTPIRIQPPGREPLPGGYEGVAQAKKAISMVISHATRPVMPPETEAVLPYRGWAIHIARNPRRYWDQPDWIRIQPSGGAILPERYRKLQHAKQAIIIAQEIADSSSNGNIACAEAEKPLG